MSIFLGQNKIIKNIFVNVNGEKKSISSVWVNKNSIPTKVFSLNDKSNNSYEISTNESINNWDYTLNENNKIVTLNKYIGSETDIIVYANYIINNEIYKTQIKDSSLNTISNATQNYMFNTDSGKKIKNVVFSDYIDTSNLTSISGMFGHCSELESIDFGNNFNTSNVTNMSALFYMCTNLIILNNLNVFDTHNVINMSDMFDYCSRITNIDLSSFSGENLKNTSYMFKYCTKINSIDLSGFNANKITNTSQMFYNCTALEHIDLRNFDTSNATSMVAMFRYCTNLKSIYVTEGKWNTDKANKNYMFGSCGVSEVTYI
ncbi:MAG: BspA family leucine-rich repeat surface protein [Ruminococcus flavefaciens]|nr:BspA family leucine-rich repeat surface protein [Ruminococcus flavefaciens]